MMSDTVFTRPWRIRKIEPSLTWEPGTLTAVWMVEHWNHGYIGISPRRYWYRGRYRTHAEAIAFVYSKDNR